MLELETLVETYISENYPEHTVEYVNSHKKERGNMQILQKILYIRLH